MEDDRETHGTRKSVLSPCGPLWKNGFLINGGGDWFPNGKANGADGSRRVNRASCGFRVTECRRRPRAQLPPDSELSLCVALD